MTSRWMIVPLVALAGALLFALPSRAQVRGGAAVHTGPRHQQAPPFAGGRNGFGHRGRRGFYNDGLFYYPDLFPGDYEETEQTPVQQVVVPPAQPQRAEPPAKPIEPVILEEQNGQWVRLPIGSQTPFSAEQTTPAQSSASGGRTSDEAMSQQSVQLPPAVLVFRDGHQEEVRNYMIQGNSLYTTADYWNTGSWTRKIPLADLDVPASLKVNAERGTKFNLPRGPNQVVVRF